MKLRYEKLRQVIGRDFVIEQVIRKYFPNPQTETKLIDISRTVSKYATNALKPLLGNKKNSISPKLEIVVIPEDICLFVFGLFFFPFVYLSMKTGLWLWFVEIYACFIIPTLVRSRIMHFIVTELHSILVSNIRSTKVLKRSFAYFCA